MLKGDAENVKEPPVPRNFDVADADDAKEPKVSQELGPLLVEGAEDAKEPPMP